MSGALPSGRAFHRRIVGISSYLSAPALAIVLGVIYSLLELTTANWTLFFRIVAVYALFLTPAAAILQHRFMAPIARWLDRREDEEVTSEVRREAFAALMALPMRSAAVGGGSWAVSAFVIACAMSLLAPEWGGYEWTVMLFAGFAAGFVTGSFQLFVAKRYTEEERAALAAELEDPEERGRLVPKLSLRAKLLATVTGVTLVPVIFAVMLSQSRTERALEEFVIGWQRGVVEAMAAHVEGGALGSAESAAAAPSGILGRSLSVTVLDLDAGASRSKLEAHALEVLRDEVAAGAESGDSLSVASDSVFAWHRLDGKRVLIALVPEDALGNQGGMLSPVFVLLLLVSAAIALLIALLLSRDVSRAATALRAEVERLAGGDLRGGRVFESEDELGELSRSFEAMARSLRDTVRGVAEAADRVETTAGEMAAVSADVAGVTASQVSGIQQATASMEAINGQVRGIADSSQALNVSVEESSSTILELGAAGEELNETASVLSSKVDEVSSSIEQMVRSVQQVSENTEALSEASVETSTSMEEMATSMREVDASAEETGRLSERVVGTAESGQVKVRQTIAGMDAIREATETAEEVIRNLNERTVEIGAIVDVIDDVADETNLLALNAAIIAAQAGEHGRAFSVVADEIKDLADRVLASTKEIGGLIAGVQEQSANAIGAIERGSSSVASGVDLSAEAGLSLEEITRVSRDSGTRIGGIVTAVREQARAGGHVVELMERVREGVDEIRSAAAEQNRGNEVVHRSALAMREVAQQVRGTTEEQARGSGRIRESVEDVREAVETINAALQEQTAACRAAVEFLEQVYARTQSNEESAKRLDDATRVLQRQAAALREDVHRFRI